jgi:hypothetical protein
MSSLVLHACGLQKRQMLRAQMRIGHAGVMNSLHTQSFKLLVVVLKRFKIFFSELL